VRDSRGRGLPGARHRTVFVGGMRSGTFIAGPRSIRLEFFVWGIRLRGAGMGRFSTPVWEIQYQELWEARLVTAPTNQGVRLRAAGSAPPVIFWTRRGPEVLDRLQEHAVRVNRAADQIPDPPQSRSGGYGN
jgi:hypothetical protein